MRMIIDIDLGKFNSPSALCITSPGWWRAHRAAEAPGRLIIAIAAAEAAVAIAIIINLYRSHRSIDVEVAEELKG